MAVAIVGLYPITMLGEGEEALRRGLAGSIPGGPRGPIEVDLAEYTDTKHAYLDPATKLALAAACAAADDAGWVGRRDRIGLALGTEYGCVASLTRHAATVAEKGGRLASPFVFSHAYPNTSNSVLSIDQGFTGYNCCFVCGSVSGAAAIAAACDQITLGREERILAGGADAPAGEAQGSCFLALQDEASAARDGASVRARILGWSCGTGEPEEVLRAALKEARLSPAEIAGSVGNHALTASHRSFDEYYGRPGGAAGALDIASLCILASHEPHGHSGCRLAVVRRDASGLTGVLVVHLPQDGS